MATEDTGLFFSIASNYDGVVLRKVDLDHSVWLEVNDNADLYRFFKVTVEVK